MKNVLYHRDDTRLCICTEKFLVLTNSDDFDITTFNEYGDIILPKKNFKKIPYSSIYKFHYYNSDGGVRVYFKLFGSKDSRWVGCDDIADSLSLANLISERSNLVGRNDKRYKSLAFEILTWNLLEIMGIIGASFFVIGYADPDEYLNNGLPKRMSSIFFAYITKFLGRIGCSIIGFIITIILIYRIIIKTKQILSEHDYNQRIEYK